VDFSTADPVSLFRRRRDFFRRADFIGGDILTLNKYFNYD
jgi:hypothetical protein